MPWNITGKTVLVTGATSGIGNAAALTLAKMDAKVIVHGRSEDKCKATVKDIKEKTGKDVDYIIGDLSSQKQIRNTAEEFKNRYDRLDILINNAGLWKKKRHETEDSIEMTFAVNHLGYFLLTNLLLDLLKKSAPSRIICVSSGLHKNGVIDFDDLEFKKKRYSGMKAYGNSKLMNVLFTKELARRLEGTNVTVNAMAPGLVNTNLGRDGGLLRAIFKFGRTPEKGARTIVYLATSPEVEGITGKYFYDEKETPSSKTSNDMELAKKLWEVSEDMVGMK